MLCLSDWVKFPFSEKSSSTACISFSLRNTHSACRNAGAVCAMTPSKSKRTAEKGFILFECLSYAPFCPRFVPGKTCEKRQKWHTKIEPTQQEYACEPGTELYSFFLDIALSEWFVYFAQCLLETDTSDIAKYCCKETHEQEGSIHIVIVRVFVLLSNVYHPLFAFFSYWTTLHV